MKFIVSTGKLLEQLDLVDGVVVSKPLLPVIENFLFELKDGVLQITTTDLETFMTTCLDVESDGDMRIAVPSKVTLETLKGLPVQPITLSIDNETLSFEINTGNGRYKLTGQSADDFPSLPEVEGENSIAIPANLLLKGINKTLFSTGTDELRLNLTGVFFEVFKEQISLVATDANRLVKFKKTGLNTNLEYSFILPKKALNLLKSSLPNDVTPVNIKFTKTYASFEYGQVSLMCRLIDERYPDYNAVIPEDSPNKLIIKRQELHGALKRVSLFSNKTTYQVRFKIAGSELNIYAEDYDYSNEATERLTCNYEGPDMEISYNSKYLVEMLANMDCEDVILMFSQSSRASLLLPTRNGEQEDLMMLIMPMMTNN